MSSSHTKLPPGFPLLGDEQEGLHTRSCVHSLLRALARSWVWDGALVAALYPHPQASQPFGGAELSKDPGLGALFSPSLPLPGEDGSRPRPSAWARSVLLSNGSATDTPEDRHGQG